MGNSHSGPLQEALRRIRSMLFAPQLILIVVGVVVAYALIFIGELAGLKVLGIHASGSTLAFILGFLIATFLCVVLYSTIVFTGAANYLTGALAERWTKKEFAALGSTWRIFSNVPFSVGFGNRSYEVDVDHIVVGPYGVLVIETKYSSSPLDLGADQIEGRIGDAMVQVEDNSGRVRALLRQVAPDVPIRPVVVFWGRLVKSSEASIRRVEGREETVRIVRGNDAKKWRPRLTEKEILSPDTVERVSSKIDTYVSDMKRKSRHDYLPDSDKEHMPLVTKQWLSRQSLPPH